MRIPGSNGIRFFCVIMYTKLGNIYMRFTYINVFL